MVTDIDVLVNLGYPRELARKSLAEANGNRAAALEIIRLAGRGDNNKEWKSYKTDRDWQNSIVSADLPKDSQMRALWKSPLTAHVNSFFRNDNRTLMFRCHIITHSRDWSCDKSPDDFLQFKSSLALGTTLWFKNSLPLAWRYSCYSIFRSVMSTEDLSDAEKMRQMLDDWVRELTLSERCMSDETLLNKTLQFFGSEEVEMEALINSSASGSHRSCDEDYRTLGAVGAVGLYDGRRDNSPSFTDVLRKIRTMPADYFPLTVGELEQLLSSGPFKIDVSQFPHLMNSLTASNSDTTNLKKSASEENPFSQLEKDLVRDRLVINGTRYQGAQHSSSPTLFFDKVVGACVACIGNVLTSSFRVTQQKQADVKPVKLSADSLELFAKTLLKAMSRTESAYVSLLGVNSILDLSLTPAPESHSSKGDDDMPFPTVLVPESVLADPILINFQLMQRKPSSSSPAQPSHVSKRECCVDCEGQTGTVYRVCAGEQLNTLLQIRVVYSYRSFAMLADPVNSTSNSTSTVTGSKAEHSGADSCVFHKPGPVHLVFMRETKTTSRDWK